MRFELTIGVNRNGCLLMISKPSPYQARRPRHESPYFGESSPFKISGKATAREKKGKGENKKPIRDIYNRLFIYHYFILEGHVYL